jgi:hypothetical protein
MNNDPQVCEGMAVRMSDGWRGKVESSAGGIVACIGAGEQPSDHWCGDYRLVGPNSVTIKGSIATVAWSSVDRERRRAAVVADLIRSALALV